MIRNVKPVGFFVGRITQDAELVTPENGKSKPFIRFWVEAPRGDFSERMSCRLYFSAAKGCDEEIRELKVGRLVKIYGELTAEVYTSKKTNPPKPYAVMCMLIKGVDFLDGPEWAPAQEQQPPPTRTAARPPVQAPNTTTEADDIPF